jgi:peptidoglycan/LPS O-acetylase OafA/YrhL
MATAVLAPPEISAKQRIPTLDGWRGIAILLVLFDHVQRALLGRPAWQWAQTGQHGVTIFFVISGFLITSKLIEGPINLKRFYIRRFFRLIPAAWTYLGVLLLLERLMNVRITPLTDVWTCLLFVRNLFVGSSFLTGHFWSLSLEEQFYATWPCVLLIIGTRWSSWIAVAGAIACASYRWFFWAHYNNSTLFVRSQVRADALLVGCLLAILLLESPVRNFLIEWSKVLALPAFAVVLFCIARFHYLPPLYESICIALLIAATTLNPGAALSRLLDFRPLAWLGTISYSTYLWQQLFMPFWGSGLTRIILLCVALPIAAIGSYYLVERPFIRIGNRLSSAKMDVLIEPSSSEYQPFGRRFVDR